MRALAVCVTTAMLACCIKACPALAQTDSEHTPLAQCEKALAREMLLALVQNGYVKGGTILALSYKGFKLSNSLEEKDVRRFLKVHGMSKPKTIRLGAVPTKAFVRGTTFRGGTIVGIILGGALVLAEFLPPDYLPGSRAGEKISGRSRSDVITAPLADEILNSESSEARTERAASEFDRYLSRNFGDKRELALLLAHESFVTFQHGNGVARFSKFEACARSAGQTRPSRWRPDDAQAYSARLTCLDEDRDNFICLLRDPHVRETVKAILAYVKNDNDEFSWDMSEF